MADEPARPELRERTRAVDERRTSSVEARLRCTLRLDENVLAREHLARRSLEPHEHLFLSNDDLSRAGLPGEPRLRSSIATPADDPRPDEASVTELAVEDEQRADGRFDGVEVESEGPAIDASIGAVFWQRIRKHLLVTGGEEEDEAERACQMDLGKKLVATATRAIRGTVGAETPSER